MHKRQKSKYDLLKVIITNNFSVRRFCINRSKVDVCFKNVTDYYTPCLEEKELDSYRMYHNLYSKVFYISCYNNGQRLVAARNESICTSTYQNAAEQCAATRTSIKFPNKIPLAFNKDMCE